MRKPTNKNTLRLVRILTGNKRATLKPGLPVGRLLYLAVSRDVPATRTPTKHKAQLRLVHDNRGME
jgi:hypothetical protein